MKNYIISSKITFIILFHCFMNMFLNSLTIDGQRIQAPAVTPILCHKHLTTQTSKTLPLLKWDNTHLSLKGNQALILKNFPEILALNLDFSLPSAKQQKIYFQNLDAETSSTVPHGIRPDLFPNTWKWWWKPTTAVASLQDKGKQKRQIYFSDSL